MTTQPLPRYRNCFVCGYENPIGLHVHPHVEGNAVVIRFTPRQEHCGFRGALHGGISASLLDEAMFWAAAIGLHRTVVTAELQVRYKKPVPIDVPVRVEAHLLRAKRRTARTRGLILDENGTVLVEAEGRYLSIQTEKESLADFFPDDEGMQNFDLSRLSLEPEL